MASKNKQKKLKNAYAWGGVLKNKIHHIKRFLFFTSAQRQHLKNELRNMG